MPTASDLRSTAELLAPSIRASTSCPICLRDLAGSVVGMNTNVMLRTLESLREISDLWSALVKVFLDCHDMEDYGRLSATLRARAEECGTKHPTSEIASPVLAESSFDLISLLLVEMLQHGPRAPMIRLSHGAPLDTTRWPSTVDDLVCLTDGSSVRSLVFWATRMTSPVAIQLLNILLAIPALRDGLLAHILGEARVDLLWVVHSAIRSAIPHCLLAPMYGNYPQSAPVGPLLGAGYLGHTFPGVTPALDLIQLGLGPNNAWKVIGDFERFVKDFEPPLLRSLSEVYGLVHPNQMPIVLRVASLLGELIHAPVHHLPAGLQNQHGPAFGADSLPRMWSVALWNFAKDGRALPCGSATCTTDSNNTTGVKLRQCGRCKIVRYCNTTCQRNDWQIDRRVHFQSVNVGPLRFPALRNISIGHKVVCRILCRFGTAFSSARTAEQFADATGSAPLDASELKTLVTWMVAVDALDGSLARFIMAEGETGFKL